MAKNNNEITAKNEKEGKKLTPLHIIPSLITLLNGLGGLLSIYSSINGQYLLAVLWLYFGFFADTFDGPVARRLNVTSKFGEELDSMCDMITFGVAPFVLLFTLNNIYVFIAFGYVFCVIIRLARFGAITSPPGRHLGLASPMAAIWVTATVGWSVAFSPTGAIIALHIIVLASSMLMVSSRVYHKIVSNVSFRNRVMDWALWLSTGFILILWWLLDYAILFIFIAWLISTIHAVLLGAPFLKWDDEGNLFPKQNKITQ